MPKKIAGTVGTNLDQMVSEAKRKVYLHDGMFPGEDIWPWYVCECCQTQADSGHGRGSFICLL